MFLTKSSIILDHMQLLSLHMYLELAYEHMVLRSSSSSSNGQMDVPTRIHVHLLNM